MSKTALGVILILLSVILWAMFLARQAKLEDLTKECEAYGYTEFVLDGPGAGEKFLGLLNPRNCRT